MNCNLVSLFTVVLSATLMQAQTGPCTESAVKKSDLPSADDAFAYMPPYGKPVIGKPAIKEADTKSFSDRTNIKRNWVGEHRIVSSLSGDMAYEYGTLHISSDSKGKPGAGHEEFEAVMLIVYKAKGAVCQQVALTMQPLEEKAGH
jgi:ketosteroid isomerase-like protein